jgi:hypothetical protein
VPPRPHDLTASLEFSEEAESFHDLLSCAFSPAHLRAPRGEPSAPAMSAEVASGQASTRASAPGVADGPALDSLSLFETTARVTAVSFGSARQDDTRVNRKRARASSSPERPHATTASAPSRVTRDPSPSRRDATARAEPSSPRNGSGDRASTARASATGRCTLPLLRVDVAAPAPPRERVARSADDVSQMNQVEREDLLPESTILSMLTPVARADPTCSF